MQRPKTENRYSREDQRLLTIPEGTFEVDIVAVADNAIWVEGGSPRLLLKLDRRPDGSLTYQGAAAFLQWKPVGGEVVHPRTYKTEKE